MSQEQALNTRLVNFHLSCSGYMAEEQRTTDSWVKGLRKVRWEEYCLYTSYWDNQPGEWNSAFLSLLQELFLTVYYSVTNIQKCWVKIARRIYHLSPTGAITFACFAAKLSHISRSSTEQISINATASCVFQKSCWCNILKFLGVWYAYHEDFSCIMGVRWKYWFPGVQNQV